MLSPAKATLSQESRDALLHSAADLERQLIAAAADRSRLVGDVARLQQAVDAQQLQIKSLEAQLSLSADRIAESRRAVTSAQDAAANEKRNYELKSRAFTDLIAALADDLARLQTRFQKTEDIILVSQMRAKLDRKYAEISSNGALQSPVRMQSPSTPRSSATSAYAAEDVYALSSLLTDCSAFNGDAALTVETLAAALSRRLADDRRALHRVGDLARLNADLADELGKLSKVVGDITAEQTVREVLRYGARTDDVIESVIFKRRVEALEDLNRDISKRAEDARVALVEEKRRNAELEAELAPLRRLFQDLAVEMRLDRSVECVRLETLAAVRGLTREREDARGLREELWQRGSQLNKLTSELKAVTRQLEVLKTDFVGYVSARKRIEAERSVADTAAAAAQPLAQVAYVPPRHEDVLAPARADSEDLAGGLGNDVRGAPADTNRNRI